MNLILAALPSPPFEAIHIGSLQLRAYGLMIALGVLAAVWLAEKRWMARGGSEGDIQSLAAWAVPAGVVGARLYHVVTNYEGYRGRPLRILQVWHGGLGIPGGIAVGVITGLIVARKRKLPMSALLDAIAPAIPLAQAIGRWGNWFNQELFGRPTSLPWGVHIDVAHRPAEYTAFATFHPTFLYESLWNLALVGVILYTERHMSVSRSGRLFAVYLAGYASGRFWIERMRVDFAHTIGGLRVNEWMSIVVFSGSVLYLALAARRQPTHINSDSQPAAPSAFPTQHN